MTTQDKMEPCRPSWQTRVPSRICLIRYEWQTRNQSHLDTTDLRVPKSADYRIQMSKYVIAPVNASTVRAIAAVTRRVARPSLSCAFVA